MMDKNTLFKFDDLIEREGASRALQDMVDYYDLTIKDLKEISDYAYRYLDLSE